jgi:hypothetical protein
LGVFVLESAGKKWSNTVARRVLILMGSDSDLRVMKGPPTR